MKSYDVPNFSEFYLENSLRYEFVKIYVITTTLQHFANQQPLSFSVH